MRQMLNSNRPVTGEGYTVRMEQLDGAHPIYLYKVAGKDRYAVQYGRQFDYGLSYQEAATKLGEARMHLLTCDGLLD